jgi:hypothetical protein
VRYLRSGWTWEQVAETARALRPLVVDAPALHKALAEEAGVGHLIERRGLIYIYPSRADFEAEAKAWEIRHAVGVRWLELGPEELRQREPDLDRRYGFGVMVEEGGTAPIPAPTPPRSSPMRWRRVRGMSARGRPASPSKAGASPPCARMRGRWRPMRR